jgi:predicted amidohydrolase YtcJ
MANLFIRAGAVLAAALAGCASGKRGSGREGSVDDVLVIGKLYTQDPQRPVAEAALIGDGRFTCVGTKAECTAQAGRGTEVLDLGAGSATPGLVDAHGHVYGYGRTLSDVSCVGLASEAACLEKVTDRAKTVPRGEWIRGRGWDQNDWPGGAYPTAASLSKAAPDHPVILRRIDGHAAWVNELALSRAGIGKETPDPAGGRFLRHPDGRPTGILVDNAMDLISTKMPQPTAREIDDVLLRAMRALTTVGLTGVHDAGVEPEVLEGYRRLAQAGKLPVRVYAMVDGQVPVPELERRMAAWKGSPETGLLTVRSVKFLADGALGSRGALLFEPYADDPKNTGLPVTPSEELRARIAAAVRAGFQPCVHAIGDRACHETLNHFVAASSAGDVKALRPRVEHLQVLQPKDVPLLKSSGAIASMQPTHATSDGPWAEKRLGTGTARQKGAYAWRQVLEAGVPLACGSDFPVEGIDPRAGLFSAETRAWRLPDGSLAPKGGWMPEQRLTREEAIRCFTVGPAHAGHAEGRRGRIRVGFDADLTGFQGDVMAVPASELARLPIAFTMVAGKLEHWAK